MWFFFCFIEILQRYLHGRTPEEVKTLVSTRTAGATPLVIASRNGHYDVVHYLLTHTNADVEETGSVVFDGEIIEGAPPLWYITLPHKNDTQIYLTKSQDNPMDFLFW